VKFELLSNKDLVDFFKVVKSSTIFNFPSSLWSIICFIKKKLNKIKKKKINFLKSLDLFTN